MGWAAASSLLSLSSMVMASILIWDVPRFLFLLSFFLVASCLRRTRFRFLREDERSVSRPRLLCDEGWADSGGGGGPLAVLLCLWSERSNSSSLSYECPE